MRVEKLADVHVVTTDLDWVMVRPGTLSDEPGTGPHVAGDDRWLMQFLRSV